MIASIPINVIIRTMAEPVRYHQLRCAIESVINQQEVTGIPIVVANGDRYDPKIIYELEKREDIIFTYHEEGSAGLALKIGREMVETDYFAFLDDDDELLAESLECRVKEMEHNKSVDVVVSSGFYNSNGEQAIHIPNITSNQADPLLGIVEGCWLSSCGGLFRSARVGTEYFDGETNNQEITLLAFKLAINHLKILFIDKPSYIVRNTTESLSKSFEHSKSAVPVIKKMRRFRLPKEVKSRLESKYRNVLHVLSEQEYRQGNMIEAWVYHIKSMRPPYTLKYLSFTRKLFGL